MKTLKKLAIFFLDLKPISESARQKLTWYEPGTQENAIVDAPQGEQNRDRRQNLPGAPADNQVPTLLYAATQVPEYLKARLRGQGALLVNRNGELCSLKLKPLTHFVTAFYYSFFQFLLLPFIRLGIPIRDSLLRQRRHYRRVREIIQDGRKRSEKVHIIAWELINKTWLFCYYRLVLLWRKLRVLGSALLYLIVVFPGALLALLLVYLGFWLERVVRRQP